MNQSFRILKERGPSGKQECLLSPLFLRKKLDTLAPKFKEAVAMQSKEHKSNEEIFFLISLQREIVRLYHEWTSEAKKNNQVVVDDFFSLASDSLFSDFNDRQPLDRAKQLLAGIQSHAMVERALRNQLEKQGGDFLVFTAPVYCDMIGIDTFIVPRTIFDQLDQKVKDFLERPTSVSSVKESTQQLGSQKKLWEEAAQKALSGKVLPIQIKSYPIPKSQNSKSVIYPFGFHDISQWSKASPYEEEKIGEEASGEAMRWSDEMDKLGFRRAIFIEVKGGPGLTINDIDVSQVVRLLQKIFSK